MFINDDCINCSACASECPVNAIMPPLNQNQYKYILTGNESTQHFYIIIEKCNKCYGFDEIKCVEVCPMNAIQTDSQAQVPEFIY